mmetsp:Transcript_5377/g.8458  ORF Transcript_5377/g.8458 Transcript_5377/m.8458 type:complete len:149 (-) Transcript_5377:219-665(-)
MWLILLDTFLHHPRRSLFRHLQTQTSHGSHFLNHPLADHKDHSSFSSPTSSMSLAFLLRASISPSSTPFWNSSSIVFNSIHSSPNPEPVLPATISASLENCRSLEGPMKMMPAMPIIISSAGPSPKKEWRRVLLIPDGDRERGDEGVI